MKERDTQLLDMLVVHTLSLHDKFFCLAVFLKNGTGGRLSEVVVGWDHFHHRLLCFKAGVTTSSNSIVIAFEGKILTPSWSKILFSCCSFD